MEDYPETQYGNIRTDKFDWRKYSNDTDDDVDEPASAMLIKMLGFNPDEDEEE
jgi:hypothetical protein